MSTAWLMRAFGTAGQDNSVGVGDGCCRNDRGELLIPSLTRANQIDLVLVDSNSTDAMAHVAKQWIAANERRFGSVTLMRTAGVERRAIVLNAIFDRSRTPYVVVAGWQLAVANSYSKCVQRRI